MSKKNGGKNFFTRMAQRDASQGLPVRRACKSVPGCWPEWAKSAYHRAYWMQSIERIKIKRGSD